MAKIKTSFSGHEKFECKIDWITKGLNAFSKNNQIFNSSNIEESITTLGLGINMIKSLKHWMYSLGLIEQSNLTELGHTILKKDPYLENSDTLWLLHWNIVKSLEQTTLYHLFFNTIYPYKFTKEDILNTITLWLKRNNINLSQTTIKSDIDVFIKMYKSNNTEDINLNLFSELKIIKEQTLNLYVLNINATTNISDYTFIYILQDYINTITDTKLKSISIDDIQRGKLSIQKVLCMGENILYHKIHRLEQLTEGKLTYSEASGIRQIYINSSLNKTELLYKIYQ